LFTISTGRPAVEVYDADGVAFNNVWLSGVTDVSEIYLHQARQVTRSGGPEIGEVTAGATSHIDTVKYIRRPKAGILLSTPAGKVSTLSLSNVRSSALGKYSDGMIPGLPFHDRTLSNVANRRG
jgi:hypothetical protein